MSAIDHIKNNPIYKLDSLEKAVGIPQSTLSKAIKGHQSLSKKWQTKLEEYLIETSYRK